MITIVQRRPQVTTHRPDPYAALDTLEWPDDQTAVLRELWDRGVTAREIAAQLGRTRNAVIGKANRLGLAPRRTPINRKRP